MIETVGTGIVAVSAIISAVLTSVFISMFSCRRRDNPGSEFYGEDDAIKGLILFSIMVAGLGMCLGDAIIGDWETTGPAFWASGFLIYSIVMMLIIFLMVGDAPDKNNEVRREMKDDCGKCVGCKPKIDEAKKCAFEKMEKREDSKLYAGRKAILENGIRCKILSYAYDNDRDRPVFLVEEIKTSGKADRYWVRFSDVTAWQEDDRDYSDMGKLRF